MASRLFGVLVAWFAPLPCPCCGLGVRGPCPACQARFPAAPLLEGPQGIDDIDAAFAYAGDVRRVVLACKRSGARVLSEFMASAIVGGTSPPPWRPDVVTWAPTTAARARRRGFDQAEALARAVAREAGIPVRPLLRRVSPAVEHAAAKGAATRPVFGIGRGCRVPPRVLLIDDVRTTGSTLSAAAATLRRAGAQSISARTFAATPMTRVNRIGLRSAPIGSRQFTRGQV